MHTFNFDGTNTTQTGDYEINLALPNQFSKMMKLKLENISGDGTKQTINEQHKVVIIKKGDNKVFNSDDKDAALKNKVVIVKNGNGEIETEDVRPANDGNNRVVKEMRLAKGQGDLLHNDFLRTMLSLFLTAPEGVTVEYFYVGASDVDGNACEIVEARTGNNPVAKIYLSKSNNLPLMMSYQGMQTPKVINFNKDDSKVFSSDKKDVRVIVRKAEASEMAEINVKFSDYRSVGGLQLPHRWTQTANGETGETVNIESYEINPANIAEKFGKMPQKVVIKTEKSQ